MRLRLIVGLVVAMACLLIHAETAMAQDGSCSLPETLQAAIKTRYLSTKLVTLADLDKGDRALFQKDHGNECPGLVKVDFYGDGKPTLALVLIVNAGGKESAELVVAHEIAQKWETVLLDNAGSSMPVSWSQSPGEYEEFNSEKKIRATRPVIVFCGYNSWAVLYAWTGSKISKIWLRD
jgi:hypothetical protein